MHRRVYSQMVFGVRPPLLIASLVLCISGLVSIPHIFGQQREELGADRAAFIFRGFVAGRGELRSGEFTVSAQHIYEDADGGEPVVIAIDKRQVFDFGGLLTRVEHKQERSSHAGDKAEDAWTYSRNIIATPEFVARSSGDNLITINRPEEEVQDDWDPRTIGLITVEELDRDVNLQALSERWRNLLEGGNVTAFQGAKPELVELVIQSQPEGGLESRGSFVFDTSRGFVPISFEQRMRLRSKGDEWSPVVRRVATTWEKIDEVYVPVSAEMLLNILTTDWQEISSSQKLIATLQWRNVNKPVDPEEFAVESLQSEQMQARIFDKRTGKAVMVFHPQMDSKELARIEASKWAEIDRIPEHGEQGRPLFIWIMALNVGVLTVFAIYFLWRKLKYRRS